MNSTIPTSILIAVLFFQLASLSITPSIPNSSFGEIYHVSHNTEIKDGAALALAETVSVPHASIVFVGDIMLGRHVERLMARHGAQYPFSGINLLQLGTRPAVVGNFEASIPEVHVPTPNYTLRFSVASTAAAVLKDNGFTHLSLANNHSFDYGGPAYEHTRTTLRAAQLVPFGSEVIVTSESLTYIATEKGAIALLGINNSDAPVDRVAIAELLQQAEQQSVLQIIYIHWGLEYEPTHSIAQKQLARFLVESGADLIVGHHPHVTQDIDYINGVPVFYSLGNYIFDQYFSTAVKEGLVLTLDLSGESASVLLHPITTIESLTQPQLQTGRKRDTFLKQLGAISHPSLQAAILAGSIPLSHQFATSSKMAIISR